MKIYTKKGDEGHTMLFNGKKLRKDHPVISFYGSLDMLNSLLGQALVYIKSNAALISIVEELEQIQKDLFAIAADSVSDTTYFNSGATSSIETWIDQKDEALPKLRNFILPSGSLAATQLHVARCSCRESERLYCKIDESDLKCKSEVCAYLNRLSDYLFTLARYCNHLENQIETPVVF
ncbi:MAG: cob(I)yrinic acid a,c-diamide adenosyltransferase [Chlamydiales bacterium]|nr:cob(I)yrinic acid a,c-diamide adenosyltransferase [Chlamydiales bacterium]NCF70446.1 cob(I)yrinic acid a,c-diamide adenosyltransferase [Chlamydiales bacterium]